MEDDKNNENNTNGKALTFSHILNDLKTAARILVVMVIVLGMAYPIILAEIGQVFVPFQSNGSILEFDGEKVGSKLIAQELESPKFLHPRPSSDSASTVDPHITPENAHSQVKNVSVATAYTRILSKHY